MFRNKYIFLNTIIFYHHIKLLIYVTYVMFVNSNYIISPFYHLFVIVTLHVNENLAGLNIYCEEEYGKVHKQNNWLG